MIDEWVSCTLRPAPRPRVTRRGTFMPTWYVQQSGALAKTFGALPPQPCEATALDLDVVIPRPPSHWTKRGALVRSAPAWPAARAGDLDNLAKSVLDAMVRGGLLPDDGQVVDLHVRKRYADRDENAGFRVQLRAA